VAAAVATGAALVASGLGTGPAGAAATSRIWSTKLAYGTSVGTVDGDTVTVRVDGDSSSVAPPQVRNTGIQTVERGNCHATEATDAMRRLTEGRRVRMTTVNPAAASMGRPVRYVDVSTSSGWVDPQLSLLRAGHALPAVIGGDPTRWKAYHTAAQQAARARANLWDTDFCGSGPSQSTPLRLWVNWDGNGDEFANPNFEYVRVLNSGSTSLSVGGWTVRTGALDPLTLPAGTKVPAHGTLTVRVGSGTSTSTTVYWGSPVPKFSNTYGSGAYLFDPHGDARAWSMYPCLYACTDPLVGKVAMSVRADAAGVDAQNVNGEFVRLFPTGGARRIDLSYRVLTVNGHVHEFPRGSVVGAGEVLTVHVGKGTTSRLRQFWGSSTNFIGNTSDSVLLRTPDSIRIACRWWGSERC
jgi:endonuclease YncB( thermonuclease family)